MLQSWMLDVGFWMLDAGCGLRTAISAKTALGLIADFILKKGLFACFVIKRQIFAPFLLA